MNMVRKDKSRGIKRLFKSFGYAFDGLKYAFKYEQNLLVHIFATFIVLILGIALKITYVEWLVLLLIIGLVIATELINTSIEAVVDLVSPEENKYAKVAKDTAAAAVLVFAMVAIVIAILIFIPKIGGLL